MLWYNYSIQTPSHFVGDGSYDYLVFHSQPLSGPKVTVHPPDFEASAITNHVVTEGYEFDAFIGADDGSNQLMLGANATMQVQYLRREAGTALRPISPMRTFRLPSTSAARPASGRSVSR